MRRNIYWQANLNPSVLLTCIITFTNNRHTCIYSGDLNPLKSELFTKQACRDALVVYSLWFSPTTYVLSTVLRKSNFTLYIYI